MPEDDQQVALAEAIADGVEQVTTPEVETPETFLTKLAETLKGSQGVDADLASILTDNLLTVGLHANAVANAKAAIVELAAKRAALEEEAVANG
ncbi:hypothetical protein C7W88_01685 [Novosphingobium sp. THN1]|uniref:hypothetical protein n=1 Tax=Novosphingobium sp. THN1 TaxID=1016987 RepID=UPI000E52CD51|nr:hypothetical protein [Novosphingobium sp. THN1]AXU18058.1 hypothetical protein C7W88_01685 [Novosphingobium sp. THN1]